MFFPRGLLSFVSHLLRSVGLWTHQFLHWWQMQNSFSISSTTVPAFFSSYCFTGMSFLNCTINLLLLKYTLLQTLLFPAHIPAEISSSLGLYSSSPHRGDGEMLSIKPEQQRSKLWKESPSSFAGAFWLFTCADQNCGVVSSAHSTMVVSCFTLSKYYPSGSRGHRYPEHLADSVSMQGPASALHLCSSLSTLLQRDGITQQSDFQHMFCVLIWRMESLPSKHHCKRKCDLQVALTPRSKNWNLKMFNLAFLASEWLKKICIFLFSFLNISKDESFSSWQRFCEPTFRAKYWVLSRGF